jgi:hypothetical protein
MNSKQACRELPFKFENQARGHHLEQETPWMVIEKPYSIFALQIDLLALETQKGGA